MTSPDSGQSTTSPSTQTATRDPAEPHAVPVSKLVEDDENGSHGSSTMKLPADMTTIDRLKHFNGMLVFFMM